MQEKRKGRAVPVGAALEVMNSPGVMNTPPRARTRVVGQPCSPTGILEESFCSPTTGARTRVREGGNARIRDTVAYFRAWRIAKFGDDIDPFRVAVDEAVAAFSSDKGEAGRERDRNVWLMIANRAGLSGFIDAFDQKASELHQLAQQGRRLWKPAASFQKLLNKRFPKKGCQA